jgi:hypothetical protein
MNEPYYNEYLGDGVYALFDGYHIWLTVNNVPVVALESDVMDKLIEFYNKNFRKSMQLG